MDTFITKQNYRLYHFTGSKCVASNSGNYRWCPYCDCLKCQSGASAPLFACSSCSGRNLPLIGQPSARNLSVRPASFSRVHTAVAFNDCHRCPLRCVCDQRDPPCPNHSCYPPDVNNILPVLRSTNPQPATMSALNSVLIGALRSNTRRVTKFMHSVVFGRHNLLLTNALISASMGAVGDSIQQNYDILMQSVNKKKAPGATEAEENDKGAAEVNSYQFKRTGHMTAAGLTTGVTTHYWYIILDRFLGVKRTPMILAKKILIDQVIFSPVNLFVYFTTLGICERSNWRHVRNELVEKGLENIYVAEWLIWPPCQLINFALLPLRYRILFDNVISLGFDIYSPYVKYKTELRCEAAEQDKPPSL